MPNSTFQMADVLDARKFLEKLLTPTRLIRAESLERSSGAQVWIKLEIENPTGTFKVRGALNAVRHCSQQFHLEGVVTSSTGNHGAAIAFAARKMNLKSRIYLPENPNPVKRDRIAKLDAEIVEVGRDLVESHEHAAKFSKESGWPLIVDVDDPYIAAGAATIACEILDQAPSTDVIVVPVGDSNLIRGIAFAAKQIRPTIRIIGVQAEAAPAYYLSWKEHRSLSTESADTIADGLSTRTTTEDNVSQLTALIDDVGLVTDDEMLHAIAFLLLNEHTVTEPAGAAATAALLKSGKELAGKNVVLVVTGANIAPDILRRAVASNFQLLLAYP
jgi:threonine dehydratase